MRWERGGVDVDAGKERGCCGGGKAEGWMWWQERRGVDVMAGMERGGCGG